MTHAHYTHPLLRGLAAGDRNGGPVRLALLLHSTLTPHHPFNPDAAFQAYLGWFQSGEAYDTGPTLWEVLQRVTAGEERHQAVIARHARAPSDGIAPAHRATPLALIYRGSELDDAMRAEAHLSHASDLSATVSVAVGRLCAALLDGEDLAGALRHLRGLSLERWVSDEALSCHSSHLNAGGYAPDVLQAALWFLKRAVSFEGALLESLLFAGSANYCPVLVGSIGGCLFGEVPSHLMVHPKTPSCF